MRTNRDGTIVNLSSTAVRLACDCAARKVPLRYACFGVSDLANTAALFERARQIGAHSVLDTQMQDIHLPQRLAELRQLLDNADDVYLSIDLDVLPGAVAPGVSAPAALGVPLSVVEAMVSCIIDSSKLRVAGIAEYNPSLGQDQRTPPGLRHDWRTGCYSCPRCSQAQAGSGRLRIQSAIWKNEVSSRSRSGSPTSSIAHAIQRSHWSRSLEAIANGKWRARSRGWPKRLA